MNKFLITALATSLVGTTAMATDSEWLELDREVAALNNAPIFQEATGLHVSGWLIGSFSSTSPGLSTDDDMIGTGILGSRINLGGSLGQGYEVKVGFDFTDSGETLALTSVNADDTVNPNADPATSSFGAGNAGLTDAYIKFDVGGQVGIKIGAFSPTSIRSPNIDRNQTLFIGRSYLGAMNSSRDLGIAFDGNFSRVNWEVAIMNGRDSTGEEFAFSAHLDVDIMGTQNGNEGAHGAAEGMNLNIGLTFASDGSKTDNRDDFANNATLDNSVASGLDRDDDMILVDLNFSSGAFGAFAEFASITEGVATNSAAMNETSPYSVGISYAFGDTYEIGFRYDDWDDTAETTRYVVGFNKYLAGHDMKWQLNFAGGDSNLDANEDSSIALGFAVGF